MARLGFLMRQNLALGRSARSRPVAYLRGGNVMCAAYRANGMRTCNMSLDPTSEPTQPVPDERSVSFVLVSRLKWLGSRTRKEPLIFRFTSAETDIRIGSRVSSDGDGTGFDNVECKACCVLPAASETVAFVTDLARGHYRVVPGCQVTLPVRVRGEERIDRDGHIRAREKIPFALYPTEVQSLCNSANTLLFEAQDRFLRLLRWSQGYRRAT